MKAHHLNDRIHIAVIGGNGFLGSHLIYRLSQQPNLRIWSVDLADHGVNLDTSDAKAIIEQVSLKLDNYDNINTFLCSQQFDYIIYCAGHEGVTDGLGRNYLEESRALTALANTLESLKDVPAFREDDEVPYFMYISSWAVYGFNRKKISNENSPIIPANYTGMIKTASEDLVGRVCTKMKMPYSILRPTEIYGRYHYKQLKRNSLSWRGFINYYVNEVIEGIIDPEKQVKVHSPDMKLDLVHVNYVTKVMLHLITNKLSGTYNVSSGESISILNLVNSIKEYCGSDTLATICTSAQLRLEDMTIDPSKIQALIPYDVDKYNLLDFLKSYIPIRREEIARGLAIEQILTEKYIFDTTSHGAKEAYLDRQKKRMLQYSYIKRIAGDRFANINYARFKERVVELIEHKEPKLIITHVTKNKEKLLEKVEELDSFKPLEELDTLSQKQLQQDAAPVKKRKRKKKKK